MSQNESIPSAETSPPSFPNSKKPIAEIFYFSEAANDSVIHDKGIVQKKLQNFLISLQTKISEWVNEFVELVINDPLEIERKIEHEEKKKRGLIKTDSIERIFQTLNSSEISNFPSVRFDLSQTEFKEKAQRVFENPVFQNELLNIGYDSLPTFKKRLGDNPPTSLGSAYSNELKTF